jgi:membrane-bound lytic murein transglycosylase D
MELPSFGEQDQALGYEAGKTFAVPEGLRARVGFWKQIYTQFDSSQALVHDAEKLDRVYAVLDIRAFQNKEKNARQQKRALSKFLKQERRKWIQQLKTLHSKQNRPSEIPFALFPLFRKFESDPDPKRFLKAAQNIRIQTGQRDKIVRGFLFGGRYWTKLMQVFEERGVPKELTRLPLVESTFDLSARSKVGASGVWQFMRSTGKRFLRIDRGIDERNDPITASWAAAELLKQNYEALESWPLAITAYNHGREGMARAARQVGSKDLVDIIQKYTSRSFGFASSNFYSEFLAILEVEREYREHFGTLMVDSPVEYEEVTLGNSVPFAKLATQCGVGSDELALLNPAFTSSTLSGQLPVPAAYRVKVPPGKRTACETRNPKAEKTEENT